MQLHNVHGSSQLLHNNAVACCRIRLHKQPGTFHRAYAGLRHASAFFSHQCCGMLSLTVAHAYLAHFMVPLLACVRQAQLIDSSVVGMLLHMQQGTFQSAHAGSPQASAAVSLPCCDMLSHAVTHATWHIYRAHAGLRQASTSHSQQMLWQAVACG